LRSVPAELLDAAKVDGAGAWTRFWRITLPMITPTILFNAVISIINAMQIFTQAVVIDAAANATPGATTGLTDAYNGSPLGALDFLNVFIYRHTFGYLQFGVGSAAAWALFVLTLVVTLLFFRSSRRWVFYQGGER
jgi:multiple sugar transport system permease protein